MNLYMTKDTEAALRALAQRLGLSCAGTVRTLIEQAATDEKAHS